MPSNKEITLAELAIHNKETDCWMAIQGKVYDVTDYIRKHPGGVPLIMLGAGQDASDLYDEAHSYLYPDSYLQGKQVGILKIEKPKRKSLPKTIFKSKAKAKPKPVSKRESNSTYDE